ncbi:MAG: hypothetical protein ACFFC5_06735, partial [Promethearchaeota archaeon]
MDEMEAIESFSERKLRVLFLGYYDSVRTHIAKAFLQDLYGEHFEAYSGGVEIREPSVTFEETVSKKDTEIDIRGVKKELMETFAKAKEELLKTKDKVME